ncbi:MAG TPA: AI-2E family transporter [Fimbriimonadaceae bacterium]|nr:AI-2E family transporter [Fimbriimonadaceae bacterium]
MGWRVTLWVTLVVVSLGFFYLVRGILLPFIISFIIAALLEPSVRKLRLRGYNRGLSVFLVFIAFFLFVTLIGIFAGPSVVRQVSGATRAFEDFTASLTAGSQADNYFLRWNPVNQAHHATHQDQIDVVLGQARPYLERLGLPNTRRAIMEQYVEPRRNEIAAYAKNAFGSFFGVLGSLASGILTLIFVPLIVFMMLLEMEDLRRRGPRWIPPSIRASTIAVMSDIGQVFLRYLRGVALVYILYAVIAALLLWFFNVPFGYLLAFLFAGFYLIPFVGSIANYLIVFLLVGFSGVTGNFLFDMGSPWAYALVVVISYAAIGTLFDQIAYPQIVGGSVGLSGVVNIFVVLAGGALFGLPGMIIAFPLAGSVKVILDRLIKVTSVTSETLSLPPVPLRHRSSV